MDKILITGGSSFLGGYLVKKAMNYFCVASSFNNNEPDFSGVEWVQLDLSDPVQIEYVLWDVRPLVIIHNAALSKLDECEKQPDKAEVLNRYASEKISRISRSLKARILYISSDMVFDGSSPPYSESSETNPVNFYGQTKLAGEDAVISNNPDHVIVRPSLMYGPPAILGVSFSEWVRKSWEAGKSTPLYTDQYRTPVFAGNLAEAVIELVRSSFTGIINVAGLERVNRHKFGLYMAEQLGLGEDLITPVKMSNITRSEKRTYDVSLQTKKAQKLLQTRLLSCKEGLALAYPPA
jgi:dTDP-4-dehydrorhamnose reductase